MTQNEPPHSIEIEEGLIACCLADHSQISKVVGIGVSKDDFFAEANQIVWQCLMDRGDTGQREVDLIELQEALTDRGDLEEVGGLSALFRIEGRSHTGAQAKHYAKIILNK